MIVKNIPFLAVTIFICVQGCSSNLAKEELTPATIDTSKLPADLRTRKTGADWQQFLGPTADGKSSEKGITAPWPKDGLPIIWKKMLGTSYGMPTISRGRLFQFDRFGDNARCTCFNSETGEEIWRFEYPTDYVDNYGYNNGPRCSPIVDGNRVFLYGAEGMLHCLRAEDGMPVWNVDTVKVFNVIQNFFGVASMPVVEGDLLIVQVGGSPEGTPNLPTLDQKGNGSGVVAFNKFTGKVVYRITDELASYAVPQLRTINGRRWCFVLARGGLLGFEPANGEIDFHFPWRDRALESVNASTPVIVGDKVFISECYGAGSALVRAKPGSHEVLWKDDPRTRNKSMMCHWMSPIYHDGHLYGSSGRHTNNAELRCIEFDTGKVLWRARGLTRCSLLMIDDHYICLGEYGTLRLLKLSPENVEEVSRISHTDIDDRPVTAAAELAEMLQYPCWAAPIVSHGLLYVRGKDHLVCLRLIPE